jgi:hypothetical protein
MLQQTFLKHIIYKQPAGWKYRILNRPRTSSHAKESIAAGNII